MLVVTKVFICFLFQSGALADEGNFAAIRSQCNETFPTPSGKCIGCGVLFVSSSHTDVSSAAVSFSDQATGGEDLDRPLGPSTLLVDPAEYRGVVDHTCLSSAKIRNAWSRTFISTCTLMAF